MARITQKEAAIRILATNIGHWFKSYELVQKDVDGKFTGIAPMERLYEVIRDGGHYDSPNNRYFLEHRKNGKYAEFRISHREPIKKTHVSVKGFGTLRDYTFAPV